MTCQEFPLLYSGLIDGCAEEHERSDLQKHLRKCANCRRHAAQMRCLRSELRALDPPNPRPEIAPQLRAALHREARVQANYARQRADWLDLWRTRIYSQGIGAVVSLALFIVVGVGVFTSAHRALALAQAAREAIWEDPSSVEIRHQYLLKATLLQPPPPPVFSPSGELLNFGASMSADDIIIATVKVHRDGRASINQIVAQPRDPSVMTKFSSVITQQAIFQPIRRNQKISAEAVVIFDKMNISG
ncbi:MAG: hypothetical protein L0226_07800 [Acidobacteria bacterium]|nr:hypothetical protein [Acidobacteriota bacterium]